MNDMLYDIDGALLNPFELKLLEEIIIDHSGVYRPDSVSKGLRCDLDSLVLEGILEREKMSESEWGNSWIMTDSGWEWAESLEPVISHIASLVGEA
jgi:hypothetical protein